MSRSIAPRNSHRATEKPSPRPQQCPAWQARRQKVPSKRVISDAPPRTTPQRSWIAVSPCHQLTRWSASKSGAGCAARSQSGSICTPSLACASQSSHNGGPRAGAIAVGPGNPRRCASGSSLSLCPRWWTRSGASAHRTSGTRAEKHPRCGQSTPPTGSASV